MPVYTSPAFTAKMVALIAGIVLTYGVAMPMARAEGKASGGVKITFAIGGALALGSLWLFATAKLINPGLIHVIVAAALIYAFLARASLKWIFGAGLALLTAIELFLTHIVAHPGEAQASDPINKLFVLAIAAWTLGFVLVQVLRNRGPAQSSPIARLAGYAAILVWVMAAAAGRWIAYG